MRRPLVSALSAIVAVAALSGCVDAVPALPAGLSVVVYQPRPDVARGQFAIQVVNDGPDDVEVIAARLSSPDFVDDVVWAGEGSTVLAGRKLDLRVPVPQFDCTAASTPLVVLTADLGGASEPTQVDVVDPYGLLPRLHAESCVGQAMARIATVTPREVVAPSDKAPAILVIEIAPTGASGSVELVAVRGTTLLQPADSGVSVPQLELRTVLSADGPTELRLELLPNRCDAHALAEDKVGTIIPFLVDTDTDLDTELDTDEPVRWLMILPDELKGDLYAYYARYCGL